jgi:hypothetical protein
VADELAGELDPQPANRAAEPSTAPVSDSTRFRLRPPPRKENIGGVIDTFGQDTGKVASPPG